MKKFERTKITLEIYGESYDLTRPTFKRAMELKKKSEDKSEAETQEVMVELLADLGLPSDITLGMEIEHVGELLEYIMPSKKK